MKFDKAMTDVVLVAEARLAAKTGRLSEIRAAAGISQSELARAIGVAPSAVCRWETPWDDLARSPRGKPAVRLALLLRRLSDVTSEDAASG